MNWRSFCLVFIVSIGSIWGQQYPRLPQLIEAGNLGEARALVERELAGAPGHPELLYWQAVVELESGRPDEALAILGPLEREGRALPPHLVLLGRLHEAREKWPEAARVYRQVVGLGDFPRARFGLGLAEFQQRNYDAAITALEPLAGEGAAEVNHLLGLARFGKGDLPEAARLLGEAVQQVPEHPGFRYDLGLALLQGGRLAAAAREFEEAARLRPDWPEAFLYMGRALHDLNRGDDALEAFDTAARLDPNLPLVEYHRGLVAKGRGQFDRAVAHFEKELGLGTNYPPLFHHLAELYSRRGQGERGRQLVEQAVRLDPDNAEYQVLAARLALEAGELEAAVGRAEAAVRLEPESGPAHYLLGRVLQRMGRGEEAGKAFEEARRLSDLKSGRRK